MAAKKNEKRIVLVRTYSAGVHVGTLVSRKGKEVVLENARRVWRWRGANTLNEVATFGIEPASGGHSRVSVPVERAELMEAIEVLSVTAVGAKSIETCGWAK